MSIVRKDWQNLLNDTLRTKAVKIIACVLAVAFLIVSGCSNTDKKDK